MRKRSDGFSTENQSYEKTKRGEDKKEIKEKEEKEKEIKSIF